MSGKRWPVAERDPQPLWFRAFNWVCAALMLLAVSLALMSAGVWIAQKAAADEGSYLAELSARGIPVLIPAQAVSDGFRVCGQLRAGMSPQTASQTFGLYYNVVGPQIVDIAQHQLCPDTLH
jgi:hypothetical protein